MINQTESQRLKDAADAAWVAARDAAWDAAREAADAGWEADAAWKAERAAWAAWEAARAAREAAETYGGWEVSGPVIGNITFASAQKTYNCPRCLGLVPLGQICPCLSPISGPVIGNDRTARRAEHE